MVQTAASFGRAGYGGAPRSTNGEPTVPAMSSRREIFMRVYLAVPLLYPSPAGCQIRYARKFMEAML